MKRCFRSFLFLLACSHLLFACAAPPFPSGGEASESLPEGTIDRGEPSTSDVAESTEDASTEPETRLEVGLEREPIPEPIVEVTPEPPESVAETTPEPEPKACQAGEACNALLLQDGRCPGKCIPQNNKLTCRGKVVHGLCYRNPPILRNQPKAINTLFFEPGSTPALVLEGESKTFTVKVTNTAKMPVTVPFTE